MINVFYANIIKKSQMALSTRKIRVEEIETCQRNFFGIKFFLMTGKTNANNSRETCSTEFRINFYDVDFVNKAETSGI